MFILLHGAVRFLNFVTYLLVLNDDNDNDNYYLFTQLHHKRKNYSSNERFVIGYSSFDLVSQFISYNSTHIFDGSY